jgi:hypothetical protein
MVNTPHIQVTLVKGAHYGAEARVAKRLTEVLSEEATVDLKYVSLSLVKLSRMPLQKQVSSFWIVRFVKREAKELVTAGLKLSKGVH